jgi:hypothetical protein
MLLRNFCQNKGILKEREKDCTNHTTNMLKQSRFSKIQDILRIYQKKEPNCSPKHVTIRYL